jgi:hypothetical protein
MARRLPPYSRLGGGRNGTSVNGLSIPVAVPGSVSRAYCLSTRLHVGLAAHSKDPHTEPTHTNGSGMTCDRVQMTGSSIAIKQYEPA